jgi:uncharacterized protein
VTHVELTLLFFSSALIGGVSALLGLGGGLFLVPLLILAVGLDPQEAAPVALVCTIGTSAAGSVALDKARLATPSLVVILELGSAVGAVVGAKYLSRILPPGVVMVVFALVVSYAGWRMLNKARAMGADAKEESLEFTPVRYPLGIAGNTVAGMASGLLGIGGGPIKVPVQTDIMGVPLKVALANSNLMVGITAAIGASVYYADGLIRTTYVGPCALGVVLGAYLGGLIAPRLNPRPLSFAFSGILGLVALQLAWKAWKTLAV